MLKDEQLPSLSDAAFTCGKCKNNRASVAVRQSLNCTECFLSGFSLKFRTLCAKNRKNKSSERILLCFSGGLSSRALLHVAAEPFRSDPNRLGLHEYFVLHLDDGLYGREEIQRYLSNYPFPFDIQHIPAEEWQKINSCTNATQREDYLAVAKRRAFVQAAKAHDCRLIYTADNSTRTAIKIIDLTSKGRGFSLPFEVGRDELHSSDSFSPVSIVRPLMEHTSKEVAFYCFHNQILGFAGEKELNLLERSPQKHTKNSLQTITEHFIVALERDYSSTVSTVSKTACKFTTPIACLEQSLQLPRCTYCDMPVPEGIDEWYDGTTISHTAPSSQKFQSESFAHLLVHPIQPCCYPCRVSKFPWRPAQ